MGLSAQPYSTTRASRWTRFALLVALVLAGPVGCVCDRNRDCFTEHLIGVIWNLYHGNDQNKARSAEVPRIAAEPNTSTFVAPPDATTPNHAERTLPSDLVAPFRIETVVGLCDPAFQPDPAGTFGLGVRERVGQARSFSVHASRIAGLTVTASFGTPSPRAFPGATRVDLAIEHDGTDLVASARDHEVGGAWFEVARAPVASPGLFLPQMRAADFQPGQMVSFYSFRIKANAPYAPGQVTPAHEAVRAMGDSLNAIADGADAIVEGDVPGATAKLEEANQHAQDAVAALDAASAVTPKKPSKAARRLKKAKKRAVRAAKKFGQALAKVNAAGPVKPVAVVKKVVSAAKDIANAADTILPDDLRAAIGGQTLKDFLGK